MHLVPAHAGAGHRSARAATALAGAWCRHVRDRSGRKDDPAAAQTAAHFLKNLGLLGGLILAAVDTPAVPAAAKRNARLAADARTSAGEEGGGGPARTAKKVSGARRTHYDRGVSGR